ncbi:MAG: arsenate reductase ArsC [Alphaproteobacteria bacterium]|nr:arsenate reductase ArsC [Alphaproteobacteria bacterium]
MPGRLPSSVLFVCSANTVRSPMAEAFMRLYHHGVFVQSVGIRRRDMDGFTIAVMAEKGIDLSKHKPRMLDELDDKSFDVAVTLTPEAHHRMLEMTRTLSIEVVYWPTLDPSAAEGSREQVLEAYRAVRDLIETRVLERFPRSGAPSV